MEDMEELVEQAKHGNSEAFTELIIQIQNELYKIAKMRLSNEEDVNDAIQETMIIAFKSIRKLRDSRYFKTWFIKILINECNKIYKKQKKFSIEEFDDKMMFNLDSIENEFEIINSNINFGLVLKSLEYEERILLTLYYAEEFTYKEIGEILGINANTVKTKITRTKNKIKKMYGRERIYG